MTTNLVRYFYHPESDCLFTETEPDKIQDLTSDGLVVELTQSEYEAAKKFHFISGVNAP